MAVLTLCVLASGQVGAVGRVASIPRQFTGEWDTVLAACKSREGDDHLSLSTAQVWFYESIGPVQSLRVLGPLDIVVDAQMSGEGETWLAHYHFRLSRDKRSLSLLDEGQPVVYQRCPMPLPRPRAGRSALKGAPIHPISASPSRISP